jgi:hypothetical protein
MNFNYNSNQHKHELASRQYNSDQLKNSDQSTLNKSSKDIKPYFDDTNFSSISHDHLECSVFENDLLSFHDTSYGSEKKFYNRKTNLSMESINETLSNSPIS